MSCPRRITWPCIGRRHVGRIITLLALGTTGCDIDTTKPSDRRDTPGPGDAAIAYASDRGGDFDLFLVRPDGTGTRRLTNNTAFDAEPAWAPDGTRLAFSSERDGNSELYVLELETLASRRLTRHPAADTAPSWSPDGTAITFVSQRHGNAEIYVIDADGNGERRLTEDPGADLHPRWSADGQRLVFTSERGGSLDVYEMDAASGDATATPLVASDAAESYGVWSPDGAWLAYVSNRAGNADIYRRPANAPTATPVNLTYHPAADGFGLSWSPDGRHIAFVSQRAANFEIYAIEVFARQLTPLPAALEATWSRNGRYAALLPAAGGALLVADTTGVDAWDLFESVTAGTPRWSPNDRWLAFTSTAEGRADVYVAEASGSRVVNVGAIAAGEPPSWSAGGGRLAFATDDDIFIARIGLDSLGQVAVNTLANASRTPAREAWPRWSPRQDRIAYLKTDGLYITGLDSTRTAFADTTLVGPVDVGPIDAVRAVSWAPQGARLYVLTGVGGATQITVIDAVDGAPHRWPGYPVVGAPVWGGDRRLLFVSERTGGREVYTVELPDGAPRNLSNHAGADGYPTFSSGLEAVAFASDRDGAGDIYAVRLADGAVARLSGEESTISSLRWEPGAARLLFTATSNGTGALKVQSGPRRLTNNSARDWFPAWAPSP